MEESMTKIVLEKHLATLVPIDGTETNKDLARVYRLRSEECNRLGFSEDARLYGEKSCLYDFCAGIGGFDPMGR